ncbi:MAG: VOC family protein [Thermoanaerobaculia bacterium]
MKDRQQPETLRLRALMPALTVNDLATSLAWYRDVLGFIVAEEIRHEDRLVAVRLKAGSVEFLLGQDDFAKGRDRAKGVALRLYCITGQDVDQLAAAIQSRGGKLAQEPKDQPWGTRDFAVVDPDGFLISITTDVRT